MSVRRLRGRFGADSPWRRPLAGAAGALSFCTTAPFFGALSSTAGASAAFSAAGSSYEGVHPVDV